jgi:hypothetical protein
MSERHLSSVHLQMNPRREQFRKARQQLLDSRGSHTVIAEISGKGLPIMNHSMAPGSAGMGCLPAECTFVLVDGELVYPLKVGINTVGRFLESDVFLCEKHISRRHCVILVHTNGACDLHDTASRNGTFLNNRRLTQPAPLNSGDRIGVCDRTFHFLSVADLQAKRVTSMDGDTVC